MWLPIATGKDSNSLSCHKLNMSIYRSVKMITKKLVAGQKFGRLTVIKEAYTKTKIQKVFRKRNNFYTTEKCNLEYFKIITKIEI